MKALSLRGVPDDVYAKLQNLARENHRSLHEQVKTLLEREVRLVRGSQVANTRKWRQRMQGRHWGNLTDDIRKERAR